MEVRRHLVFSAARPDRESHPQRSSPASFTPSAHLRLEPTASAFRRLNEKAIAEMEDPAGWFPSRTAAKISRLSRR